MKTKELSSVWNQINQPVYLHFEKTANFYLFLLFDVPFILTLLLLLFLAFDDLFLDLFTLILGLIWDRFLSSSNSFSFFRCSIKIL